MVQFSYWEELKNTWLWLMYNMSFHHPSNLILRNCLFSWRFGKLISAFYTQPSFIFSMPILLKLPWQWECCSFFLGKMTFSNALLYYFINTCPTVTWTVENSPIYGFHHLFITSLIKMSNQNLFWIRACLYLFSVLVSCVTIFHFFPSPNICRKMSKMKQSLILDN